MLRAVGRTSGRFARPQARMMSSLQEKVASELTRIKDASGTPTPVMSIDELKAQVSGGAVDMSKLSELMSPLGGSAQKLATSIVAEINTIKKTTATPAEAPDFAKFAGMIETPGVVDQIKAIYDAGIADPAVTKAFEEESAANEAMIKSIFNGPDGLVSAATKEAAASDAGLAQCIAELETIEKQIGRVSETTIAEILEMEPELKKELEAEIDNNNWAP